MITDPLTGKRAEINNREVTVLTWPAVTDNGSRRPCPVKKGDRFQLRSCEIEIVTVNRKLPKGRKPEWHATFIRHEDEKVHLLKRTPSGLPEWINTTRSDTDRARVESAYTSSPKLAIVNEPESVGPDWKDTGVTEREAKRQEAARELADERQAAQVRAQLGRTLTGLNTTNRANLLAAIIRACKEAENAEPKKTA